MYKIVWTGSKLSTQESDGAWSSAYDTGKQPPVIKVGTGTGSTPTLMGFGNGAYAILEIYPDNNLTVSLSRSELNINYYNLPDYCNNMRNPAINHHNY